MFMTYYSYTTGTTDKPNSYTNTSGKLHPKLNFTLETEVNNSMNFLNLTITKTDNRHTFNITENPPAQ